MREVEGGGRVRKRKDVQHCASGWLFSSAQQPPNAPVNKYGFVSSEVAHQENASEGERSQNAPIRLCASVCYYYFFFHRSNINPVFSSFCLSFFL